MSYLYALFRRQFLTSLLSISRYVLQPNNPIHRTQCCVEFHHILSDKAARLILSCNNDGHSHTFLPATLVSLLHVASSNTSPQQPRIRSSKTPSSKQQLEQAHCCCLTSCRAAINSKSNSLTK